MLNPLFQSYSTNLVAYLTHISLMKLHMIVMEKSRVSPILLSFEAHLKHSFQSWTWDGPPLF